VNSVRPRIGLVSTPVGLTGHERLYLQNTPRGGPDLSNADSDMQLFWSLTHNECTSLGYSDISRALFVKCPAPHRRYMPWEGLYILYREVAAGFPDARVTLTDIDL
jgi:hypothetical protein